MIPYEEALTVQRLLIEQFGGTAGLRDEQALKSALERPYQTFEGQELYPTAAHKAAALFESIISNHPFIDGNKRLAYALMMATLAEFEMDITASEKTKYDFVMSAAKGELSFEEILAWINDHCVTGGL